MLLCDSMSISHFGFIVAVSTAYLVSTGNAVALLGFCPVVDTH